MLKIFLLLLSLFLPLSALNISETKNYYKFDNFKIYQDEENRLSIDDILKIKNKFLTNKKINIGIKKYPIWSYNTIENRSDISQMLLFTHPRAGLDFMDVYIFEKDKLIQKFALGDMNPLENRTIQSRKSNFFLKIQPQQKYEIFIRYKSFGAIDTSLEVYQPKFYANMVKTDSMVFGFIIGGVTLILLSLLALMLYFPNTATALFFFILFGSVALQLSVAGVFYEMGINSYYNTIISWSFGNLAAAFIGLFPIYYFNLKNILPKITLVLQILSFALIALSCSFLIFPFYNEILYLAPYANLLFFLITLVLLVASYKLYIKKINGYKIFGFGNSFFLLCAVYFVLGLLGVIATNELFYFALIAGTFVNIFCLGLLILIQLLQTKKDKEQALLMLNEYSKLSSVGQSMINLSHQWKEPLNHIYFAINNIYAAREFQDKDFDMILEKSLRQIKDTATYMTNTGKNFLSVHEDKTYTEDIDIKTSLESVLAIFAKQIHKLNIQLMLDLDQQVKLQTNKYLLANVFMAIIENSIKIFHSRGIKNPFLSISLKKEFDKITISISDNAGGIKESPIDAVFEKDTSDSNSTGLGLYLVKNILNLKLNGSISVQNRNNGAVFLIVLNIP